MSFGDDNPTANRLGNGLTQKQVEDAVRRSGYPVQTMVANILRSTSLGEHEGFHIQEEWCFVDRNTHELRNLDLRADLRLHEWEPQPRVRPQLTLLIECKQSELPYVFFESGSPRQLVNFPRVAGLRSETVVITSDDDPSSWHLGITSALDLQGTSFQERPTVSNSFSKCARKGKELELSGSEAYNGIVLPLVKSLQHALVASVPVETAWYFDAHLLIAIAVLDAPMIVVRQSDGQVKLTAKPWIRLVRHEYRDGAPQHNRDELWAIDVIHKDFLSGYLLRHLIPFGQLFAERVLRHTMELATGRAFVPGMGRESWEQIESRMQPASVSSINKRATAVTKRRPKR